MDLTDISDDVRASGEDPPNFTEWEDPDGIFRGEPIRERLLDMIVQLREPMRVSEIANRAECDTETARDYLEWFYEMGMVRETAGRPVRYERNDSYMRWRRIEWIREQYSEEEIVEAFAKTIEAIEEYREQFDAETPSEVSLVDGSNEVAVEEAWEALSDWRTLKRRAELLDAARRDENASPGNVGKANV